VQFTSLALAGLAAEKQPHLASAAKPRLSRVKSAR
jgi:hypothetical protein